MSHRKPTLQELEDELALAIREREDTLRCLDYSLEKREIDPEQYYWRREFYKEFFDRKIAKLSKKIVKKQRRITC